MNEIIGMIVLAVVVLLVGMQIYMRLSVKRMEGKSAPDTGRQEQSGVYYFFSESCGPCKAITPMIESMQQEHSNLHKVDVMSDLTLAQEFGIRATPTFVVVRDGKIDKVMLGAVSEKRLRELLN